MSLSIIGCRNRIFPPLRIEAKYFSKIYSPWDSKMMDFKSSIHAINDLNTHIIIDYSKPMQPWTLVLKAWIIHWVWWSELWWQKRQTSGTALHTHKKPPMNHVCKRNIASRIFFWIYSSIVFLQFLTVGTNMIAIWGVESRLYLAIDEDGTVFTTVSQWVFV
jgi:hypothetical protein